MQLTSSQSVKQQTSERLYYFGVHVTITRHWIIGQCIPAHSSSQEGEKQLGELATPVVVG